MANPPPYTAADAPLAILYVVEYIPYLEYPKMCLVSRSWRDVFQVLLWSQPDKYFSTPNRGANGSRFKGYY